jgi:hypothetical protein
MKIKSSRDFWSGAMFVTTGAAFASGALAYNFGASARPGPGYFPFGLGLLLALLGAFTMFESLTIDTEDGEPIGAWAWKPLALILGSVALFGFLLPRLGMVLALPLLIVVSSLASDEFSWKATFVNAVVLTLGSWLIFIKGLNLTIPLWPNFIGA